MKTYELLGWIGAAVSCCFAIPQAVKLVRQSGGSADGLSIWTWILLEANALCWAVYAIGTQAYPAGAPSLVNAPCSAYIIWRMLKSKRATQPSVVRFEPPTTSAKHQVIV